MSNNDCTKNLSDLIHNTDWAMLREQKKLLAYAVRGGTMTQRDAAEGLLNLIDALQDAAAEILGEEMVFGKEDTGCDGS